MACPKPHASVFAALPEELSKENSNEPLVLPQPIYDQPVAGPSGTAGSSGTPPPTVGSSLDDEETGEPRVFGDSTGRLRNLTSEELKSMWNWKRIFSKLGTHEQCIQFAEERGLLPREKQCSYHRKKMTLTTGAGQLGKFRCCKSNCRTKSISRAIGTWFENARLPLTSIFQLMYAFCMGLTYNQTRKELVNEDGTVLSIRTVADWFHYCRQKIVVYELENQSNQTKIGGPNKIVQIDKSKFGRSKNNRGRHIEGHWVIGMIEDGNDDLRLEVCPGNEHPAEVLVPLIKKHVQEGSIIHTDFWRGYLTLPEHGYIHKRVNHSDPTNKFVAPDGTHTQRIESQWRGLKQKYRQQHHKHSFIDWLCEFSWRRKIRIHHLDPYEELIKAIKHVYKLK